MSEYRLVGGMQKNLQTRPLCLKPLNRTNMVEMRMRKQNCARREPCALQRIDDAVRLGAWINDPRFAAP